MNEEYRRLFDEVHASRRLEMEVLQMSEQKERMKRRRVVPAAAVAAVLAVLVLAGSALAVFGGSLKDWFAREWYSRTGGEITESQSQVIDSLTQKVGESAVSGGVTVTVDSITVGGDALWVLLEAEGLDFSPSQRYSFGETRVDISTDPAQGMTAGMSYSVGSIGMTEEGALRLLLQCSALIPSRSQLTDGGYTLELRLEDLDRAIGSGRESEVVGPGSWSFSIPLTVECLSPVLTVDSAVVTGAMEGMPGDTMTAEDEVALWDIQLTATGISYLAEDSVILPVTVTLEDGTEVTDNSGGGSRLEDGTWYASHQWPVPIEVEKVVALHIGDTEIPLP